MNIIELCTRIAKLEKYDEWRNICPQEDKGVYLVASNGANKSVYINDDALAFRLALKHHVLVHRSLQDDNIYWATFMIGNREYSTVNMDSPTIATFIAVLMREALSKGENVEAKNWVIK